jgi:LmbE family N-acetylglucosaminyl deacetylase
MNQDFENIHTVCVIVAHPDDETLWAGGMILMHPEWDCKVFSLCRASDPDRAPKFYQALLKLGVSGHMEDFDDRAEQIPLSESEVQQAILNYIDNCHFDLILSHGPQGEYTRHRRHEEVSKAVLTLWLNGNIDANKIWLFAYTDGNKTHLPFAEMNAHYKVPLPPSILKDKQDIIAEIYGFSPDSWEMRTTPQEEAYWIFNSQFEAQKWLKERKTDNESLGSL